MCVGLLLPVVMHGQQGEVSELFRIVLDSQLQHLLSVGGLPLEHEQAVEFGVSGLIRLVLFDDAAVQLFRFGVLGFGRQGPRQLHHHADLPGLDRLGFAILGDGLVEQDLPLVLLGDIELLDGPRVVQIASEPVTVVGIRVALQQLLAIGLNIVQVGLLARDREVNLAQLDGGVPVIGLAGGQQLDSAAKRVHGLGDGTQLESGQAQLVVRRPPTLVLGLGVEVHDARFFELAFVEVLVSAFEITPLGDVGIAAARYQR